MGNMLELSFCRLCNLQFPPPDVFMHCVLLSRAWAAALSSLSTHLKVGEVGHRAFLSVCLHVLVCGLLIKICCHPGSSNEVSCVVFTFPVVVFL